MICYFIFVTNRNSYRLPVNLARANLGIHFQLTSYTTQQEREKMHFINRLEWIKILLNNE